MKKSFLLILMISFLAFNSVADELFFFVPTEIYSGQEVTLTGSVQELRFRNTETLKATLRANNGVVIATITVLGAGGCKVSNETIVASHYLYPQNSKVIQSIKSGEQNLWVQGTNGQTIVVAY